MPLCVAVSRLVQSYDLATRYKVPEDCPQIVSQRSRQSINLSKSDRNWNQQKSIRATPEQPRILKASTPYWIAACFNSVSRSFGSITRVNPAMPLEPLSVCFVPYLSQVRLQVSTSVDTGTSKQMLLVVCPPDTHVNFQDILHTRFYYCLWIVSESFDQRCIKRLIVISQKFQCLSQDCTAWRTAETVPVLSR